MSGKCPVRGKVCPILLLKDIDLARVAIDCPTGKSLAAFCEVRVNPLSRKYSCFQVTPTQFTSIAIPSREEGRWPSSRTLGRVAVDAAALRGLEIAGRISVSDQGAQDERR
jgi:hypothetical protein